MDRRVFLGGVAASLPSYALASPPATAVRPVLRNAENVVRAAVSSSTALNPELANITGFALFDAVSGELVDAYQPDLALPPASVTKAVTAIYARSILGGDFRFSTRVYATGPVVGGAVQGDLYLVGSGDPALDTDELASLAKAVVAAGIRGITGHFYVDSSALPNIAEIDPTQPDHLGYNPSISGTNLNFNRVYFEWKQASNGYRLTLDARAEKFHPLVKWMEIQAENRDIPVFSYANVNGHDHWSVAQNALGNGGGRWLPVRQPADYVGEVFETLAAGAGLRLPAHRHRNVPRGAQLVAQFDSNHLDEIIRWMLKYSNNLTAECLGLMASRHAGKNPRSLQDSAKHMSRWVKKNLGVSGASFQNHSGLTDSARVSSAHMAGLLSNANAQAHLSGLLKPFNLMDAGGHAYGPNIVKVHAKTGTLNFTRGLAGYIEKGGRKYSFAIFSADLETRSRIPMAQRERPRGAKTWSNKAKRQEQAVLRHWLSNI